jgi:SWI/SNF-related matrix-associated actin-dependent regulator 1 of chromatin subfamily A
MTLDLFPYQAQAADIMASRDRYGLHDEMGIGKTATTIGAINRILGRRGIIVCPAMLRENWVKEFKKFSTYDLRLCKGQNIHDFVAWSRDRFDVLITSYEQATKWATEFGKIGEVLDFVAFDEAHYMKNSAANRTRALLGEEADGKNCLVEWAEHAWHVTGTPMANDPLDIYTFLRFAKAFDMPQKDFVRTFYTAQQGTYGARHFVKPEMVSVLQKLIYNNAIRRTHSDVGMQLPPIWMKEVFIEGETREIIDLVKDHPGLEQSIVNAIESGNLAAIDVEYVAMLRRLIGKAKMIPYAHQLKWELDSGAAKRVVFGIHSEPSSVSTKLFKAQRIRRGSRIRCDERS